MAKKITAIVIAVIGLIVVIMGASISGKDADTSSYSFSAGYFDIPGASFGADFYTYMYDGSDTIVEELYNLNIGVAEVIDAQNYQIKKAAETTEAVYKTGGMIVIAIGLAIIAYAAPMLISEFVPEDFGKKKEVEAVEDPVEDPVEEETQVIEE